MGFQIRLDKNGNFQEVNIRNKGAERSKRKSFKRLEKKRNFLVSFLESKGLKLKDPSNFLEVLLVAKKQLQAHGLRDNYETINGMHGAFSNLLLRIPTSRKNNEEPKNHDVQHFYRSGPWRQARYAALKRYGFRCMACGLSSDADVIIHVDHIKPIRLYWELRLDEDNLQVLCELCNHGKGSWDETDFRRKSTKRARLTLGD